ncbi:MAG: homocysteine S-methyltransferase family protein [Syntrophobacter sp.]
MADVLEILKERTLLCDGALGSYAAALEPELFKQCKSCTDLLTLEHEDLICRIHGDYLEAGSDAIETNTFNASPLAMQAQHRLSWEDTFALNLKAVRLARKMADEFAAMERPRFVFGSIGPGHVKPSLGKFIKSQAVDQKDLIRSYAAQATALCEGGVDAFLIETSSDILQIDAALEGIKEARAAKGYKAPLFVSVTIEKVDPTGQRPISTSMGHSLLDIARLAEERGADLLGLNCGTGPEGMKLPLRFLQDNWKGLIGCQPNAGLPTRIGDQDCYMMKPEDLSAHFKTLLGSNRINLAGGCCGTTPLHIKELGMILKVAG